MLGQIATVADADEAVPGPVQDERRHSDRGHAAQVVLEVGGDDGPHHARPNGEPLVASVPAPQALVLSDARREQVETGAGAPQLLDPVE